MNTIEEHLKSFIKEDLHSWDDFRPALIYFVLHHRNVKTVHSFISKHRKVPFTMHAAREWRLRAKKWLELPKSKGPICKDILEKSWSEWREQHGFPTLEEIAAGWTPFHKKNITPKSPQKSSKPQEKIEPKQTKAKSNRKRVILPDTEQNESQSIVTSNDVI